MVKETFIMQTELVASDDGRHTYEVRRSWSKEGGKGLVLELYPTLSAGRCGELDLSTMHLLNHVKDFGWGLVRIVNLYSLVCAGKLKTSQLEYDAENVAYMEEILESKDIRDYDIVIATGSSFSSHVRTVEMKADIFQMIVDKGLEQQVKCIVAEPMSGEAKNAAHPLFLGLHYGRHVWKLEPYQLREELKLLKEVIHKEAVTVTVPQNAGSGGEKKEKPDVSIANQEKAAAKKGGKK